LPTIKIEILSSLARPFLKGGGEGVVEWREEVALGETLGRLLERLVYQQPGFREIYEPGSRRVGDRVELVVNGRTYQLIGGLTYTLNDGDKITMFPRNADGSGGSHHV
jgi:molybdopterin converting factor small subunit